METLDSMIEVVFKCKLCNTESESFDGLRLHVIKAHYGNQKDFSKSDNQTTSQIGDGTTEKAPINIIVEEMITESDSTEADYNDETIKASIKTELQQPEIISENSDAESAEKSIRNQKNSSTRRTVRSNKCTKCAKRFKDEEELVVHQESHYENNTFKCIMCDFVNCQWTQVKNHMETHNNSEANKCSECDMTFASPLALKNHWRFQHLGGKHLCDVCGFEASSKYTLFQHRMKNHSLMFTCHRCAFSCDNEVDFKNHMRERHDSGYTCKYCSPSSVQFFATQHSLHAHMTTIHAGKKCFICDRCNYVAKLRHHLEKHYLMHTGERPFKCQINSCDYSAKDLKNFKQHMVMKHSKPEDLVCRQCLFVTADQNEWDVHTAMHHMKVFQCKYCDYQAKASATLRRHRLAKHVNNDEMRHPCPHCSYRTNFRESLNKHLLTHVLKNNRHRCPICKKDFNDRPEVKIHLAEHHSDEALKIEFCRTCSYSCKKSLVMRQHMLTHSKEKTQKCEKCDYSARTNSALRAHLLRKHHGDESGTPTEGGTV